MEDEKKEIKKERDLELKEIGKVLGLAEAEVIKSLLESQGIDTIFCGQVVPSVLPFSTDGLGEIRILVSEKDYEEAKRILENRVSLEKDDEE